MSEYDVSHDDSKERKLILFKLIEYFINFNGARAGSVYDATSDTAMHR